MVSSAKTGRGNYGHLSKSSLKMYYGVVALWLRRWERDNFLKGSSASLILLQYRYNLFSNCSTMLDSGDSGAYVILENCKHLTLVVTVTTLTLRVLQVK